MDVEDAEAFDKTRAAIVSANDMFVGRVYIPIALPSDLQHNIVKMLEGVKKSEWQGPRKAQFLMFGLVRKSGAPSIMPSPLTFAHVDLAGALSSVADFWKAHFSDDTFSYSTMKVMKDNVTVDPGPDCSVALLCDLGCYQGGEVIVHDPHLDKVEIPTLGHVVLTNTKNRHVCQAYKLDEGHSRFTVLFTTSVDALNLKATDPAWVAMQRSGCSMAPYGSFSGHSTVVYLRCSFLPPPMQD